MTVREIAFTRNFEESATIMFIIVYIIREGLYAA